MSVRMILFFRSSRQVTLTLMPVKVVSSTETDVSSLTAVLREVYLGTGSGLHGWLGLQRGYYAAAPCHAWSLLSS